MFTLLFLLAALTGIIVSFWSPAWGWGVVLVAEAWILFTLFSVKLQKWKNFPELSDAANAMLQKYGHYYTMPFGAREFSGSSSAFQLASFVLGGICAFKGAWWGVGLAVANLGVMAYAARAFNPTAFITDPLERIAHDEVIAFIMERQHRSFEERQRARERENQSAS